MCLQGSGLTLISLLGFVGRLLNWFPVGSGHVKRFPSMVPRCNSVKCRQKSNRKRDSF